MGSTDKDPSQIEGKGVDADPNNDPTYPMKHRTDGEHEGYSWERPRQQPLTVEVLHSNERPDVTAVFGTSTPPSGPSGALRRLAFKYSESSYGHWLPLMLADRVGVVEGLVGDLRDPLARGRSGPPRATWAGTVRPYRLSLVTCSSWRS